MTDKQKAWDETKQQNRDELLVWGHRFQHRATPTMLHHQSNGARRAARAAAKRQVPKCAPDVPQPKHRLGVV